MNENRNLGLDVLKLLMAIMVVSLHTRFLADLSPVAEYLTVNGVFRIAVPIFFIINGYFFYPYILKNKPYIWIKRVVFLYMVWMLFYLPFWIKIPIQNPLVSISEMLVDIFRGFYHLWYLNGMIGASLMLIALKKYSFWFNLINAFILFSCGVVVQYFGIYHVIENITLDKFLNMNASHRNFIFLSFPFFCIGFLIHKNKIVNLISTKTSFILSILGLVFLVIESFINYQYLPREIGFDNLLSLMLICPAIFIFFQKINIRSEKNQLSNYSSGIYFVHIFVLILLKKYFFIAETLLAFLVLFLSLIISYFLIKLNNKFNFFL